MPSRPSSNLPTNLIPALVLLAGLGALFLLTSCASVPDVPVCVEINMTKGFCTNTVSDKDYYIDEKNPVAIGDAKPQTWWEMRPYMILVPVASWKEFKAYIIKQCKRTNCDQYIKSWDRKINELDPEAK